MPNRKQIVVSYAEKWWFYVHINEWTSSITFFEYKKEAIEYATKIARALRIELKIQRRYWDINTSNTYAWDPFPPIDR